MADGPDYAADALVADGESEDEALDLMLLAVGVPVSKGSTLEAAAILL